MYVDYSSSGVTSNTVSEQDQPITPQPHTEQCFTHTKTRQELTKRREETVL